MLKSRGYVEERHFTHGGLLYMTNEEYILSGPLGKNRIQVRFKKASSEGKLSELEEIFQNLE